MMQTRSRAYRLSIRAILIAIIIVQSMVPFFGFIPLFVVSLTIIHITVIVAAITLGTKDGMLIGFVWGLATIIRAWTMPTSPFDTLIFTNPIVSVLPRVCVGLVAGFVFTLIYKRSKKFMIAAAFSAALGSITNTVLVLALMGLLYTGPVAEAYNTTSSGLFTILLTLMATNGLPEAIVAVILAPLISGAIFKATKLSPETRD